MGRVCVHAYKNISENLYFMLYTEKINKNKDFLNLYKKGQALYSKWLVIYVKKNNLPCNRLGITAGKKVGNAVKRNRAKRIIRQAYSENEIFMPIGIDIIIVARAAAVSVKSTVLSSYLKNKAVREIEKIVSDSK